MYQVGVSCLMRWPILFNKKHKKCFKTCFKTYFKTWKNKKTYVLLSLFLTPFVVYPFEDGKMLRKRQSWQS